MLRHSLKHLVENVDSFSNLQPTAITIRQLIKHGAQPSKKALLLSSQFLHNELPIRIARLIKNLETLPYGLSETDSVLEMRGDYLTTFQELLNFPVMSLPSKRSRALDYTIGSVETSKMFRNTDLRKVDDSLEEFLSDSEVSKQYENLQGRFIDLLQAVRARHENDIVGLARGIHDVKAQLPDRPLQLNEFIDPFQKGRLGIRLLVGHHIALSSGSQPGHIGIVSPSCNIRQVVAAAGNSATFLCMQHYPQIMPPSISFDSDPNLTVPCMPSVLYYISFELLKNSLRATVEFSLKRKIACPQIDVVIAAQGEDMALKISDKGGGIPRSGIDHIWSYTYTTAPPLSIVDSSRPGGARVTPLAGYGYGLPISRLYARYFGGDLKLMSLYGYGTDAYLYMNRIGDVVEALK